MARIPGRVPEAQRRRRNADSQPRSTGERRKVLWPAVPDRWDPMAKMLYSSAQSSGQIDFYQQSDVAFLIFLCDQVDYYQRSGGVVVEHEKDDRGKFLLDEDGNRIPVLDENGKPKLIAAGKRSAMMLTAILSQFETLLISEGARRRLRMELKEPEPDEEPPELIMLEKYKQQAGKVEKTS